MKTGIKLLFVLANLCLCSTVSTAQSDVTFEKLSNSYEKVYDTLYPTLNYSYHEGSHTHDYSNNWDFDRDGKKDGLFFIGGDGAHLYFHLRIILSSDDVVRDYKFLTLDIPYLGKASELENSLPSSPPPPIPQFVVSDFDSDRVDEVYLNFDITYSSIPDEWKKRGVSSRYILVEYENGDLLIKDYKG